MRLLEIDVLTGFPLKFRDVDDPCHARYAILSHVWEKKIDNGVETALEQTYHDLREILPITLDNIGQLSEKLRGFCLVAARHGYSLVWADMCCINQASSAELSEAISSMYDWYRHADVCYAYLHDIAGSHDLTLSQVATLLLHASEWFRRGWTLQELIAPRYLVFLLKNWEILGTKRSLANHVRLITNIPPAILSHEQSVHEVSVAERMSWAACRRTTKPEDQAYCLMGLFGIRMPVMYGEGTYAFVRLQEEILKRIPDPTLLAWGPSCGHYSKLGFATHSDIARHAKSGASAPRPPTFHVQHVPARRDGYLFATSPADFLHRTSGHANCAQGSVSIRVQQPFPCLFGESLFQLMPFHTLHMRVPVIPLYRSVSHTGGPVPPRPLAYLALLGCETLDREPVALLLCRDSRVGGRPSWYLGSGDGSARPRIATLEEDETQDVVEAAQTADLYVSLSPPTFAEDPQEASLVHHALGECPDSFSMHISEWSAAVLRANGYVLSSAPPAQLRHPHTYLLILPDSQQLCPHEKPHNIGERCSDPSGILEITFATCTSPCCSRHPDPTRQFLWGDVQLNHTLTPRKRRCCGGPQSHVTSESWIVRDGVATKRFAFTVREWTHSPYLIADDQPEVRTRKVALVLTLRRMPSNPSLSGAASSGYLLDVEFGGGSDLDGSKPTSPIARRPQSLFVMSSPDNSPSTRRVGGQFLTENTGLLPISRLRSNSAASLGRADAAPTPTVRSRSLHPPTPVSRQRSRSVGAYPIEVVAASPKITSLDVPAAPSSNIAVSTTPPAPASPDAPSPRPASQGSLPWPNITAAYFRPRIVTLLMMCVSALVGALSWSVAARSLGHR